jgi:hypothetical protein
MADDRSVDITIRTTDTNSAPAFTAVSGGLKQIAKDAGDASTAHGGFGTKVEEVGAKLVTGKLSVDGLTGALQNQIGMSSGASSAIGEILTALGPMGVIAAGAATGILAVGGAVFGLMDHAANSAHELEHLSASSGISVDGLSALRYAAGVLGEDLTSLTNASFMLQKQLGQDAVKAKEGAELLGLSYRDLKAAKPEEALLIVSDALRACQDEQTRTAAGADLMSRGYKDSAYLMQQDLRGLTDEARATGQMMSEDDVKAAHDFELGLNHLKVIVESTTLSIGVGLIHALDDFVTHPAMGPAPNGMIKGLVDTKAKFDDLAGTLGPLATTIHNASGGLVAMDIAQRSVLDSTKALSPEVKKAAELMFAHGESVDDVRKAFEASKIPIDVTEKQLTSLHDWWQKNTTDAKAHATALKEIASAQIPLTAAQTDQLNVDLKLHLSEDQIAKDIGATVTQVRLSIDASKEKQKELVKEAETEKQVREQALKQLIAEGKTRDELGVTEMKRLSDSYQEKRRLEDEYDDLISRSTKTEYDYEVDRIQKEGEARKREAKDRGTLTSDNLTDINNITEVKLHELQVKWHQASEGIRVDWLTMTLNIEDSFVTGLADSLTHLKTWKQAGLDVLGDFEKEAEKIFAKLIQEALDWYLFAPTGSGFNWANVLKSAAPGITGAAATTTAVTGAVAGTTVAAGAVPVVEVGAGPGALAGAPKAPWWQGMVPGGNVPTSGVIYNGEQLTWQESQQLWDLLFGKLGGAEQENPIHKDTAGPEVWDPGVLTVVDGSGGGDTITGLRQGTGGEYWDFGAGTPVILHGLEAVVPQSDQPTIHGSNFTLAGGPSAPAGPIVLQVNLDGKVLARNQYDNLLALFTERGVFSGS